jgi:hypothetical protein
MAIEQIPADGGRGQVVEWDADEALEIIRTIQAWCAGSPPVVRECTCCETCAT